MIAMHLIASYRNGTLRTLPQVLPAGLHEAASRRGGARPLVGSRPSSGVASVSPINRQFTDAGLPTASSPGTKPQLQQISHPQPSPDDDWAIGAREKENFDQIFSTLDTGNRGCITGEQAVGFFGNSRLPEEMLAQIWDLADINSEGRLNREEFAVAMFLIRQERTKQDPRDVLPQALPANLVPPSMRRAPLTPFHPSMPATDPAPVITTQKSAAEDLVGLDASPSSAPEGPLVARNLSLRSPPPLPIQDPTQVHQEPQNLSSVRPFVPSLSFDQAMMASPGNMSPQSTGFSSLQRQIRSESLQPRSIMDDLLGDNDPEISKKLTQETADLANLSNQVSNLTSQMQQVKAKRLSTEQDLSKAQSQKREFEVRLSQLRSAYEEENVVVKALGERLSVSKSELRVLEQDLTHADSTLQDLQSQHKELTAALDADRRGNVAIKERIRQSNIDVNLLRPQLEKLKSDARQQKGLVAISKKQLATNEIERERIKREIEDSSKELNDATREAEETTCKLQQEPRVDELSTAVHDPIRDRSPSTTSLNPFLRRAPTESRSSPFVAPIMASPNHNAFDNFFGSTSTPYPQTELPPTTFTSGSPHNLDDQPLTSPVSEFKAEEQNVQSPSNLAALSASTDSPQVPPAPPRSRQITSSFLPLRNMQRSDSTSSSVIVAPPRSRAGDASGSITPTDQRTSNSGSPRELNLKQRLESRDKQSQDVGLYSNPKVPFEISSPNDRHGDAPIRGSHEQDQIVEQPKPVMEIPGSFPSETTALTSAQSSGSDSSKSLEYLATPSVTRPHDSPAWDVGQEKIPSLPKDDFDAAFEGFGNKGKEVAKLNGNTSDGIRQAASSKSHGEFPPIEEIGSNEESDSESDYGFDDNFTTASPKRPQKSLEEPQTLSSIPDQRPEERNSSLAPPSSAARGTDQIQLPSPNAETPSKDHTVVSHGQGSRNTTSLPAEPTVSMPSQAVVASYPASARDKSTFDSSSLSSKQGEGLGLFAEEMPGDSNRSAPLPFAEISANATSSSVPYAPVQGSHKQAQPQPVGPLKNELNDDFENEFGDLAEAKEADDKGEDEAILSGKDPFDDFNPVFDPPIPSRTAVNPPARSVPVGNGFHDFESSVTGFGAPTEPQPAISQPISNQNYDWDAMFAGLDSKESKNAEPALKSSTTHAQPQPIIIGEKSKPVLNRGLSTGTAHDDPILTRLVVMGYPREASLSALEKFDYNIDKVSLR